MSAVLARLRVRETAGIRRFLYPLTAYVSLPKHINLEALSLATEQGAAVPVQVIRRDDGQCRIDFAVSLAPLQGDVKLLLTADGPQIEVPDPLYLTQQADGKLVSRQERFSTTLGRMGSISEVVYDGIGHLAELPAGIEHDTGIRRPDPEDANYKRGLRTIAQAEDMPFEVTHEDIGGGPLSAWCTTEGVYADGCKTVVGTEITACKSWVILNYRLEQPAPGERIFLGLMPEGEFRRDSTTTIFDTGINGIYGQTNYWGASLRWLAPSSEDGLIRWEVEQNYVSQGDSSAPRMDYVGTVTKQEFPRQLWFHMVNGSKAIAVVVTKMPTSWQKLEISIRRTICITVTLADEVAEPMEFGVCYHFLNDVPAIAAATNPQSILLPPVVEVL